MKKYPLVGGTRNGEHYECNLSRPPLLILMTSRITLAEFERLKISETIMHHSPDDVYALGVDGKYYFERTISYFPGDYK